METKITRFTKKDLVVLLLVAAVLLVLLGFFAFRSKDTGAQVKVTVAGETYGVYDLSKDQEIPIIIDGETTNLLVIQDGVADMTEADCPDKLCVHQKAISKDHETIVCLPNKVVAEVEADSEQSEIDSIAK